MLFFFLVLSLVFSFGETRNIYLVGEDHGEISCANRREAFTASAIEKEVFLFQEGLYFKNRESLTAAANDHGKTDHTENDLTHFYGLEDTQSFTLSALYERYMSVVLKIKNGTEASPSTAYAQPLLAMGELSGIDNIFAEAFAVRFDGLKIKDGAGLEKKMEKNNYLGFVDFYEGTLVGYMEKLAEEGLIPKASFKIPSTSEEKNDFFNTYIISWRNDSFAVNIAKKISLMEKENIVDKDTKIIVNVGSCHLLYNEAVRNSIPSLLLYIIENPGKMYGVSLPSDTRIFIGKTLGDLLPKTEDDLKALTNKFPTYTPEQLESLCSEDPINNEAAFVEIGSSTASTK